jgi:hypothetical protein
VNVRDALPRIAQIVRGCPTPTLVKAYVDAARDFCGQTRWLRDELATFSTTSGDASYTLTPTDAQTTIIGVRLVWATDANGNKWPLGTQDELEWSRNAGPNPPRVYAYVPESEIVLYYTPDAAYSIDVTAQIQPTEDATEVPDILDQKWGRVIASGALAYLLDLPGQKWTNHGMAEKEDRKFKAGINNAKADEQRGYNTGARRAKRRTFVCYGRR